MHNKKKQGLLDQTISNVQRVAGDLFGGIHKQFTPQNVAQSLPFVGQSVRNVQNIQQSFQSPQAQKILSTFQQNFMGNYKPQPVKTPKIQLNKPSVMDIITPKLRKVQDNIASQQVAHVPFLPQQMTPKYTVGDAFSNVKKSFVTANERQREFNNLSALKLRSPQQEARYKELFNDQVNMVANVGGGGESIRKASFYLRSKLDKEAANTLKRFAANMEIKGLKGVDPEDLKTVGAIMNDAFGAESLNWSPKTLKNTVDLVLGKIGTMKNNAGLGLSVGNIRDEGKGFTKTLRDKGKHMGTNVREYDNPLIKRSEAATEGLIDPLPWETDEYMKKMGLDKLTGDLSKKIVKPKKLPQFTQSQMEEAAGKASYIASERKPLFDDLFKKWIGTREVAKTTGFQVGSKYSKIPVKHGTDVIRYVENPNLPMPQNVVEFGNKLKNEYHRLFLGAKAAGVDLDYVRNYITHIWDRPQDEVVQAYRVFKQKFQFASERKIPTYEEGIRMGLKPKYLNPSQIMSEYVTRLEQTKANITFFKQLKDEGFIIDAAAGRNLPGFTALDGPGFPKSVTRSYDGSVVQGTYYAPTQIAKEINRLFSPEDHGITGQVLKGTAWAAGKAQDIAMSGGVPYTPVNAFTLAQVQRDITANLVTPWKIPGKIAPFFRAFSQGKSLEYFKDKAEVIKRMQMHDIQISSEMNTENLVDLGFIKNTLGSRWGNVWDKTFADATFKRYMPMQQISMFEDIEKNLIKNGKTQEEASELAAKALKMFHGLTGTAANAKATQLGKDTKGTFLFAPTYRQAMIKFWVNNVKAISPVALKTEGRKVTGVKFNNPLSQENAENTRFMIGAALTYGMMNHMNHQFNGHGMDQNPKGKEDKLLIPVSKLTGKEDDAVIGIPFMSSIATIPRALYREGKMLAQGDFKGTVDDALSTYPSVLARPFGELSRNENYFGKEIVPSDGTPGEKFKAAGMHLAGSLMHPYAKELITPANQGDPMYQRLSRASELPLRFYSQKSIEGSQYYANLDEAMKGLSAEDRKQAEYMLSSNKNLGPDSDMEAKMMIKNPNLIEVRRKLALAENPKDPIYSRSMKDIQMYLAYQATDDSDTGQKSLIRAANPWIPLAQYAQTVEMYKKLKGTEHEFELNPPTPLQKLSEEQVKVVSLYTYMNKANDPRKRTLLQVHPWLKSYWDARNAYYQQYPYEDDSELAQLLKTEGLEMPSSMYGATGYSRRPRKVRLKKVRIAKGKKVKPKKVKLIKVKQLRSKKFKVAKYKDLGSRYSTA